MKPIRDGSWQSGLLFESDLSAYFERLLNELDELEECDAKSDSTYGNVRLDCSGEFVDVASVGLAVVRSSASGAELIEFVCPRCDRPHESLRFREALLPMEQ
jgi:hypothetical protein